MTDPVLLQIHNALKEDLGDGDITTQATVSASALGQGFVKAKSDGVLCGREVFSEVFRVVDASVKLNWTYSDGHDLKKGDVCVRFEGSLRSILTAERTALNFMQRLSGIASLTRQYTDAVALTHAKILDTRKTTPLWRALEKYAVMTGGGENHRFGLYDMFLIKDNHISAAGSLTAAIEKAIEFKIKNDLTCVIEVETKSLDEIKMALKFPIQRIMLDNMSVVGMKTAVDLIHRQCEVEASGNVSLSNVRAIAETGVDFISVGALTHSAPAMDYSLLLEEKRA